MTLYKIKLASITLILFIAGCTEKDDLTLPVRVYFKIGISPEYEYSDTYLSFAEGQIGIQRIQFEGKREAGEDVFFETDPQMNLQILAFSTGINPVISDFDIPQGIYNYMKWDINLKRIVIDNYTDSLSIGLVISGIYEYSDLSSIPVVVYIDDTEQFTVKSSDLDGNSSIVLSVNKDYYEAILVLAPGYTFSSISRESLEKAADISRDRGHSAILISSSENEDLYENLLYRIEQSAKIIFK
jgi:hypothetical protein